MSIDAVNWKGVNRAKLTCDGCGRSEPVTCDYERISGNKWVPNIGQVRKKAVGMGWAEVKGKDYCMTCETNRKVVNMSEAKQKVEPARKMTPRDKRQIIATLEDCYDDDAKCYTQGDTDNTLAEALGVMPGWVAEIREELFGPDGGNEDMTALQEEFGKVSAEWRSLLEALDAAEKETKRIRAEMGAHKDRLDSAMGKLQAIRTAVGAHVLKKAGA